MESLDNLDILLFGEEGNKEPYRLNPEINLFDIIDIHGAFASKSFGDYFYHSCWELVV